MRKEFKSVLREMKGPNILFRKNDDREMLKSLNEKEVFYMKADKGNSVVILDKSDYR